MKRVILIAARIIFALSVITMAVLAFFGLSRRGEMHPEVKVIRVPLLISLCVMLLLDRSWKDRFLTEWKLVRNYIAKWIKDLFNPYKH